MDLDKGNSKAVEALGPEQEGQNPSQYNYLQIIYFVESSANYISPQINRAVKNKSYFYNCYGKEEKFYIENQG